MGHESGPRYFYNIWRLRYFWLSLVQNDLARRYRRSFLGVGWSLVRPLGLTVLFCGIFGQLLDQRVVEYGPFLLLGLTIWQFLAESALHGCHCFQHGAVYLRQQPLPLAVFPLRVVLGTGFHALIAFALAGVVVCVFQGPPSLPALLWLLPGLALLFLLGWCAATLFGLLHAHFPDTYHLLELGLQVVFYLTPILYPPDSLRQRVRLAWLLDLNPLSALLQLLRSPLVFGQMPSTQAVLVSCGFVAAVGLVAWLALRRCERTLVFWI